MRTRGDLVALALIGWLGCKGQPPPPPAPAPTPAPAPIAPAAPPLADAIQPAPIASAAHAMVVSEEPLATAIGVKILDAGGNAADAAVATAFALAVAHPQAGNIGGGGFAVIRAADGKVAALDFRETAPAAASRDMYLDAQGKPTEDSLVGHRAAGVPGSVAGLYALHQRYGKLPWKDVVAPAIALAEDGFPVPGGMARGIGEDQELMARFPGSARLFLPGGKPLAKGDAWKNPDLARTLGRIAKDGPRGFYQGETARLTVAEMKRGGGLISAKDLAGYQAVWREPITFGYHGYTLYSMPPPSSGGVVLAMLAGMLDGDQLGARPWHDPASVHLVVEAMRRAYAARNTFLGDPSAVDVPVKQLTDLAYLQRLRASIDPAHATPSDRTAPLVEPDHTTHLAAVDREGLVVALTTTINGSFGSEVVVEGAGYLLNNEMDDFAVKPGTPNTYGLVQGEANAIAPGRRMLSSMSPTIVVDAKGQPVLVTGAQGGSRIITAVWQVIMNVLDFGMDVGHAVAAPRFHHQHLPDELVVEEGALSTAGKQALEALGHKVVPAKWPIASTPTLVRDPRGGWQGSADPRKSGVAAGD